MCKFAITIHVLLVLPESQRNGKGERCLHRRLNPLCHKVRSKAAADLLDIHSGGSKKVVVLSKLLTGRASSPH